jgi:hypothetical protein
MKFSGPVQLLTINLIRGLRSVILKGTVLVTVITAVIFITQAPVSENYLLVECWSFPELDRYKLQ